MAGAMAAGSPRHGSIDDQASVRETAFGMCVQAGAQRACACWQCCQLQVALPSGLAHSLSSAPKLVLASRVNILRRNSTSTCRSRGGAADKRSNEQLQAQGTCGLRSGQHSSQRRQNARLFHSHSWLCRRG